MAQTIPKSAFPAASRLRDITALLLVGGMGTRLRAVVSSKPKPLAPVGEVPFLQLLVLQLRTQGVRQIVMCAGFQAGQIQSEFGDGAKWDMNIRYSNEAEPLGTAGALKLAAPFVAPDTDFLVLNGDSFLELDISALVGVHRRHAGCATIAVRRVEDAARYGTVHVGPGNRVTGFAEKLGLHEPGLINGGVYVFRASMLTDIPGGPVSLEKEVLPYLLEQGVFASEQSGIFIDIGTPEDYSRAQDLYIRLSQAAIGHQ